jgi:hypothetical protein
MKCRLPVRPARLAALVLIGCVLTGGSLCPQYKNYRARFKCQFQLYQGNTFLRMVDAHEATLTMCKVDGNGKIVSSITFEEKKVTDQYGYAYMGMHGFNVRLDDQRLFAVERIRAEGVMNYEGTTYRNWENYLPNVQEDPELHDFNIAVKVDINQQAVAPGSEPPRGPSDRPDREW